MKYLIYKGGRHPEIIQLFSDTFPFEEYQKEGSLIGKLAKDLLDRTSESDLKVFLCTHRKSIIGCVMFSKLRFQESNADVWLLSPIAVKKSWRNKRIGSNLLNYAHSFLRNSGAQIIVAYSEIGFYPKVGYMNLSVETIQIPLKVTCPNCWVAISLKDSKIIPITGKSYCVEAINDPRYW
ncbi:GNAT family N-acetyltransferase [Aquimarina spongiae]|uniref:Acetyltransferase (GNAT) domain-containing protein n=1 Tax=Aquimarina spongiae TaxID=570521 RepID=A0A1M6HE23_9FLAO|nr:GNAT family N-acetyltransferase [Aquimarina spongiae]SHJ20399.1 Acetyltransferase (GNAT) domain-containing protein [Aquimarina spongiae]